MRRAATTLSQWPWSLKVSIALPTINASLHEASGGACSCSSRDGLHISYSEMAKGADVDLWHAEIFHKRIEELRKHILQRPEQCIAVVTHSGVLEALTGGVLFRNGEIRTLTSGELIARTG